MTDQAHEANQAEPRGDAVGSLVERPVGRPAPERALELLASEVVDLIANDGMRNAAGGIYATSVHQFAIEVQREFARVHGLRVNSCGA